MMLCVKNLSVGYGKYTVLDNISFDIMRGDYVAIVGENGSGKSTLIKALTGLIDKQSGQITFSNKDVNIGYLSQVTNVNDGLFPATVMEIASMGLLLRKKFPKILNKTEKQKLNNLMVELGIEKLRHCKIGDLSGGQIQRVMLARALATNPDLLILDEPTSALDPKMREDFYGLIQRLNQTRNVTVILVSHDVDTVKGYANKIMYLDRKMVFYGNSSEFCS